MFTMMSIKWFKLLDTVWTRLYVLVDFGRVKVTSSEEHNNDLVDVPAEAETQQFLAG